MPQKHCLKMQFLEKQGDNPLFFIKFTEKREYAEDVLNGFLYMNPIGKFREKENQELSKGQKDSSEARCISHSKVKIKIKQRSTGKLLGYQPDGKFSAEVTNDEKRPIFCIVGLKASDLNVVDYNEDSITFGFQSENFNLEQIKKEFGNYAVIIHSDSFNNAIERARQNDPEVGPFKEVIYTDPSSSTKLDAFISKSEDRLFYKDLKFSYQKEWRLILNKLVNDAQYFEIGSLSDFAEIIEVDQLSNIVRTINY